MDALTRLADVGSAAIGGGAWDRSEALGWSAADVEVVGALLARKDGFYAFEGALHVFPGRTVEEELGVFAWNAQELWRSEYEEMTEGVLCFAEDVFGNQFGVRDERVILFDAETGDVGPLADDLEQWAQHVLDREHGWAGHVTAKAWQAANGMLARGKRLLPTTPFVLGGAYSVENLRAVGAVEAMRVRGAIARQLRGLPDGAAVRIVVTE